MKVGNFNTALAKKIHNMEINSKEISRMLKKSRSKKTKLEDLRKT